jgi:hypothetical protein
MTFNANDKRPIRVNLHNTGDPLDKAHDAFQATPTNKSAGDFMALLMEYESNGMIGDDIWLNGLSEIGRYLSGER